MLWQGAQPLNADEIRVGQYKSLNVYHGSEKPRTIARRKGISRQNSDSDEASGE